MTATGDAPPSLEPQGEPERRWPDPSPGVVHQVCPYLKGEGGGWRSLSPTRDHQCAAMQPAAEPSLAKQREMCLRPAHTTCATYQAARALEEGEEPDPRVDAGLWPATQQSVLALEPARAAQGPLPKGATRTGGQAILAGLMVAAFLVLVVARTTPSGAAEPGASLAAVAAASAPVASIPLASVAPSPGTAVTPSPAPSASAAASPNPSAAVASATPGTASTTPPRTTHRVRSGDTLSSVAIAYGVTVRQLRKANGLDGNVIRTGQELVIP